MPRKRHAWLVAKASRDSAAGATAELPPERTADLWLVHGRWYDLSGFARRHPGGRFWIEETRGTDVTDLYETHHLDAAGGPDRILAGCLVGPAAPDYRGLYDYEADALYPTLKRRVAKALRESGGSDATPAFLRRCRAVLLGHCVLFAATAATGSLWLAALTGVTISSLHGIGHNFMHQADNWWMYAATAGGWNVHLNRVSHAISHHPMPNTDWDLEILGHEPWLFNMCDRPANSRWVALYGPLLCCSGHLLDVVLTWSRILTGRQAFEIEMLSNVLQVAALCCGCGVLRGTLCWGTMFLAFGAIDAYAGYPLHHTEGAWTVGDAAHARKRDLAEHVVAATVDYDVGAMSGWKSLLCHELMPNHCLHHCFPTVDCSRFPAIRGAFEATLREFGVRQKLLEQPYVSLQMMPAWLRGTDWHAAAKRLTRRPKSRVA